MAVSTTMPTPASTPRAAAVRVPSHSAAAATSTTTSEVTSVATCHQRRTGSGPLGTGSINMHVRYATGKATPRRRPVVREIAMQDTVGRHRRLASNDFVTYAPPHPVLDSDESAPSAVTAAGI